MDLVTMLICQRWVIYQNKTIDKINITYEVSFKVFMLEMYEECVARYKNI
jgi:hypothetical protein